MISAKKLHAGLMIGAISMLLTACGQQEQPMRPPPQVEVSSVHSAELPINYEYAARIAAFKETEVRARVGGILLHRNFVEGSAVRQGDVLFEIDPDQYAAAAEAARARVAQAQANYDQSVRDANRAEELVKQKVQSTAQRDQAFATRDANRAALMQAQADLRTAELNLDYTKVIAPISGLTSREAVPEGSLIGTDPSSSLLTTITQSNPVYVNFSFSDSESVEMKQLMAAMKARGEKVENLKVTVHLGDGSVYPHEGTVDFTSPTIDQLTGTLGARAVVDNPDQRLVPGMFVRVDVTGLKMANAMTVPESALTQTSKGQYVYVAVKPQPLPDDAPEEAKQKAQAMQEGLAQLLAHMPQGTRVMMSEQRPVHMIRQMQDGSWLIAPVEKSTRQVPLTEDEKKQEIAKGVPAEKVPETKEVPHIIGLNEGDEVVLNTVILQQVPPGTQIPVLVLPSKEQMAAQAKQSKAAEPAQ